MKKFMLIIVLSIHSISTWSSEPESSLVDHDTARSLLAEDYNNYLKHQLEWYKKNTEKPLSYFDTLKGMGIIITAEPNYRYFIRDIQNNAGETFLHVAVDKEDISFIKEIFKYYSSIHIDNKGRSPFDIAIEKLMPGAGSIRNSNQIVIVETIAQQIAKGYSQEKKETCLKQLITLELTCKAHPNPDFSFIPNKKLLENLTDTQKDSENFLAKLYQEAIDPTTGNTFAHVFVQQENPDELFSLALNNRISHIKNKEDLDPLHFALRAFRKFTTAKEINTTLEGFNKARCCYFILYHYFSKSSGCCCDKHKIPTNK